MMALANEFREMIKRFLKECDRKNYLPTMDELRKGVLKDLVGNIVGEYYFKLALDSLVECGIVGVLPFVDGDAVFLNPDPPKPLTRQCKTCGSEFFVTHPTHRFCSRECAKIFFTLTNPKPWGKQRKPKKLLQRIMTDPNLQHLATELFLNADD